MTDQSSKNKPSNGEPAEPQRLKVDYIKSNFFRVVHADGVYGGGTPAGFIHMDLWSERSPIPRSVTYAVETTEAVKNVGRVLKIGPEIESERESRQGMVREVEVGIVMTVDMATEMVQWLQDKIKSLNAMRERDHPEGASK